MSYQQSCIFCQILAGQSPASFVYEDEDYAAFMDIQPVNPGHLLVIPRRHATYLADMEGDAAAGMMAVGHGLAAALRSSGLPCEGVNLFLADGAVAGQEVFHVHLHVIPRFTGDHFGMKFDPGRVIRDRDFLDASAAHVLAALGRSVEG